MALPSLDSVARGAGDLVKGAVSTASGSKLGSAVGNVGGGLVQGAVRAGVSAVDRAVGGSANRRLIEGAAGSVIGGAKDLLTGKESVGNLVSGGIDSAKAAAQDVGNMISGGIASAKAAAENVGNMISGGIDSAKNGLDTIINGPKGTVGDVTGMCYGDVGGALFGAATGGFLIGEGSDWGKLSEHLIARLYVCDSDGIADPTELLAVTGPISDATFEATFNWQSPFEGAGPEAKAPALMAMLQSGSLVPVINALQALNPVKGGAIGDALNQGSDTLKRAVQDLQGRTGITKLNSRQVFSGMPPVKLSFTIYFRAITDASSEVVAPYQRLLEWAMPQQLAKDGILSEVIKTTDSVQSFIKAMFPSTVPKMVAMTYGNNLYSPMVIESLSNPIDGPMNSSGEPIYRAVQITLATLTALDRADVAGLFL